MYVVVSGQQRSRNASSNSHTPRESELQKQGMTAVYNREAKFVRFEKNQIPNTFFFEHLNYLKTENADLKICF